MLFTHANREKNTRNTDTEFFLVFLRNGSQDMCPSCFEIIRRKNLEKRLKKPSKLFCPRCFSTNTGGGHSMFLKTQQLKNASRRLEHFLRILE